MIVCDTNLKGVKLIKPDIFEDFRGTYSEAYNVEEYKKYGITDNFVQDDLSTTYKGVIRGMHGDPKTAKLVSCAYGRIYQVVLNYDKTSEEYGKWQAFLLLRYKIE